jgi:uncharacterized membrane protein YjdF
MEIVYLIALILLITIPRILKYFLGVHVPLGLEIATAIFLVLTLFLGSISNYYEKYAWWDAVLHFSSGLILTPWALITMRKLNTHGNEVSVSPIFIAFYASCFSITLAALWEMYEFAYDIFLKGHMTESGLPDTLGDLIANLVGTAIVALIIFIRVKHTRRIPFTKLSLN